MSINPGASVLHDTATTPNALAHYLHSAEWQPDANFINGQIEERPVGEDNHSAWQLAIQLWFAQHAEEWNIRVRPELRVQVKAENYLIADVAILDAATPRERIAVTPPLAVFEVWSPANRVGRMMRNLRLYEAMGIPQIWLVDPEDGSWQRFNQGRLEDATTFAQQHINFEMQAINALVR
jgi:Uma2 family endonuclease